MDDNRVSIVRRIGVSVRTQNCLLNGLEFGSEAELFSKSDDELLKVYNFGRGNLAEFRAAEAGQRVVMPDPSERGREAIRLRESGCTFREIGQRMGVSASRARELVSKAERQIARKI